MLLEEKKGRRMHLLEVAGGTRLGGCLAGAAAADGDGGVDCDHLGEDVEDGLEGVSKSLVHGRGIMFF